MCRPHNGQLVRRGVSSCVTLGSNPFAALLIGCPPWHAQRVTNQPLPSPVTFADLEKKRRRSSPPRRTDLRLDRGTPEGMVGGADVPCAGRVARGVLRLAQTP